MICRTERQIEASGISLAPPPRLRTSTHQKESSQTRGRSRFPSNSPPHRSASPSISPERRGRKQHRKERAGSVSPSRTPPRQARNLSPTVTPPKSSRKSQAMPVDEPTTPLRHKRAVSEFPHLSPKHIDEGMIFDYIVRHTI